MKRHERHLLPCVVRMSPTCVWLADGTKVTIAGGLGFREGVGVPIGMSLRVSGQSVIEPMDRRNAFVMPRPGMIWSRKYKVWLDPDNRTPAEKERHEEIAKAVEKVARKHAKRIQAADDKDARKKPWAVLRIDGTVLVRFKESADAKAKVIMLNYPPMTAGGPFRAVKKLPSKKR